MTAAVLPGSDSTFELRCGHDASKVKLSAAAGCHDLRAPTRGSSSAKRKFSCAPDLYITRRKKEQKSTWV